jgi:hypothetical protein
VDGSVVRGHPDRRGTTWVDAPPAVVWALVSDIGLMPTLSEELHAVEWLDGVTEPALGRRFVGRSKHASFGEWETTCTVVEYEPGVVFAWAVQDPDNPSATWRFRLEPEGRGTRLSQWAQMGPGPSGLSSAIERMPEKEQKIVYVRLKEFEQGMTRNLEAIKQRMEAGR